LSKPQIPIPEITISDLLSEVEAEFDRLRAGNRRLASSLQSAQEQLTALRTEITALQKAPQKAPQNAHVKRPKKPTRTKTIPPQTPETEPPTPAPPKRRALGTSLAQLRPQRAK
jgi:hypothetical protein